MMLPVWRDEDEALYARLTDEAVATRLFAAQAGREARLPPRAAGLCAAVRATPGGKEALEAAQKGDLTALIERLSPGKRADDPPELLHHLAIFHARIADAQGGAVESLVSSLIAWLALGREGKYLRELGRAVTGGALKGPDLDNALADAPLWCIDDLGERARAGARDLTAGSRAALAALGRVREACTRARLSETDTARAASRANRLAAAAVEDALAPILVEANELAAKDNPTAASVATMLSRITAVWRWSGEDESVEHVAVEQTSPLAWAHYRASRWQDLGTVIEPVWPLIDSLARRIEADPMKLTYAAGVAQLIGFRSDVAKTKPEERALLERAVKVCPTHRNARYRLAFDLCEEALRMLPGAKAPTRRDYEHALALVDRAETLYVVPRIEEARKRLGEAKRLLGIT